MTSNNKAFLLVQRHPQCSDHGVDPLSMVHNQKNSNGQIVFLFQTPHLIIGAQQSTGLLHVEDKKKGHHGRCYLSAAHLHNNSLERRRPLLCLEKARNSSLLCPALALSITAAVLGGPNHHNNSLERRRPLLCLARAKHNNSRVIHVDGKFPNSIPLVV